MAKRLHYIIALQLLLGAAAFAGEYEVKATFLYHFSVFVTWPEKTFASETAPIVIGILGEDPFGKSLKEAVQDETVNERPLKAIPYKTIQEASACQILFISASEQEHLADILKVLDGKPVLTVCESPAFCESGGIVNFATVDGKIKIRINPGEAKRAKLEISSKLLNLATLVESETATKGGGGI